MMIARYGREARAHAEYRAEVLHQQGEPHAAVTWHIANTTLDPISRPGGQCDRASGGTHGAAAEDPAVKPGQKLDPNRPLNLKQQKFVDAVAAGKTQRDAAELAGYTVTDGGLTISRSPRIKAAIEKARAEIRANIEYDVETAMAELTRAIEFGYSQRQAMAVVRAIELRSRLKVLLVDKFADVSKDINLTAAIDEARKRLGAPARPVIDVTPAEPVAIEAKPDIFAE